jgi:hypothetical protein
MQPCFILVIFELFILSHSLSGTARFRMEYWRDGVMEAVDWVEISANFPVAIFIGSIPKRTHRGGAEDAE